MLKDIADKLEKAANFTSALKGNFARLFGATDFVVVNVGETPETKSTVKLNLSLAIIAPWLVSVLLKIDGMEDANTLLAELAHTCMPDLDRFLLEYKEVVLKALVRVPREDPHFQQIMNINASFDQYVKGKCDFIIQGASQDSLSPEATGRGPVEEVYICIIYIYIYDIL